MSPIYNVRVLTADDTLVQYGFEKPEQAFYSFGHYASRPADFKQGSLMRVDADSTRLLAFFHRE